MPGNDFRRECATSGISYDPIEWPVVGDDILQLSFRLKDGFRVKGIIVGIQRQVGEFFGVEAPVAFGMPDSALDEDKLEVIEQSAEGRCLRLEDLNVSLASRT